MRYAYPAYAEGKGTYQFHDETMSAMARMQAQTKRGQRE